MPRPSPEAPQFWIVAGANGSGKSTLYGRTDIAGFGRAIWIIDPDLLSARIARREGLGNQAANAAALDRIWSWLEASIDAYQTIGVETVLSTNKYRVLVERAKAAGFDIRLLYVCLKTEDLNVQRVRLRVAKGGHDVEEAKIRLRRQRSLAQLPWFLDRADRALVYDNSGDEPELVAEKTMNGAIELDPSAPDDIRLAIERLADNHHSSAGNTAP